MPLFIFSNQCSSVFFSLQWVIITIDMSLACSAIINIALSSLFVPLSFLCSAGILACVFAILCTFQFLPGSQTVLTMVSQHRNFIFPLYLCSALPFSLPLPWSLSFTCSTFTCLLSVTSAFPLLPHPMLPTSAAPQAPAILFYPSPLSTSDGWCFVACCPTPLSALTPPSCQHLSMTCTYMHGDSWTARMVFSTWIVTQRVHEIWDMLCGRPCPRSCSEQLQGESKF